MGNPKGEKPNGKSNGGTKETPQENPKGIQRKRAPPPFENNMLTSLSGEGGGGLIFQDLSASNKNAACCFGVCVCVFVERGQRILHHFECRNMSHGRPRRLRWPGPDGHLPRRSLRLGAIARDPTAFFALGAELTRTEDPSPHFYHLKA